MWLAASSFDVPDGVLATLANAPLNPKPHQGVPSKNPAPHPALDERNSTAAIGLRAGLVLHRVRQSERARYYGSALGRWTSADEAFADQHPDDPQSWNLYSYVRNNPLALVDDSGRGAVPFALASSPDFQKAAKPLRDALNGMAKNFANNMISLRNGASTALKDLSGGAIDLGQAKEIPESQSESQAADAAVTIVGLGVGGEGEGGATEGIYEFPDATAEGRQYVGQSGDLPARLDQHVSSGKLAEGTEVKATAVPGGKTAREVAETTRIKELGGKSSDAGSQTSNKRLSVSDARMKKINGQQSQSQ